MSCCRTRPRSIPSTTSCSVRRVADPEGNRAQVRFSRKTKEQYVMTEVDGKATGWKAFYHEGKWQQEQSGSGTGSGGRKRS